MKSINQLFYWSIEKRINRFTCDICGKEVFDGEKICSSCKEILPYNRCFCSLCGRAQAEEGICLECKSLLPKTDKARSPFIYKGEIQKLVLSLKQGNRYLAKTMAEKMLFLLNQEFDDADFLCFPPMFEKDEKERGYNQAEDIAYFLSKACKKTLEKLFIKICSTKEQKKLNSKDRRKNLKGVFRLKEKNKCRDKKILIIDDVLTTGATSDELAGILKEAGAKKVYLLTFASVEYVNL